MIKLLIIAVAVLILFGVVAAILKAKMAAAPAAAKQDAYYLRKTLFTPAERSLLGVLEPMLPIDVRVFGKVRLEDIIGVKKGLGRGQAQAARNRINRKHVDFLLVTVSDLRPIVGIELDDASHEEENRQERDAFVDSAFSSAGLPLIHIPAQRTYSPAELRTKLGAVFN
ncbi:MAG: DUF2726 domain-containing protein [Opitutaceae bacterium]